MRKKYQVFVSSTYIDLKQDRQTAVEAILSAGHIPAGMELFSAGNESQLNVIKRWIDESDVYLLILGGRYGSVDPDSGKSYTQLEYEYALEKHKPLFAVVMSNECLDKRIRELGQEVIELENRDKFWGFKKMVLSKICRFYDDSKDIKIAIFETLNDFHQRLDMPGWISGKVMKSLDKYVEEISIKDEEIRKLKFELDKKSFLPNLEEEQSLLFKQTDINTRVVRVITSLHYDKINKLEPITWIDDKEEIYNELNYVCSDFTPYFIYPNKDKEVFNSIGFVCIDDGEHKINLNELLYQVKIQIDEIPSDANMQYDFFIVSERIESELESKIIEAFKNILANCKHEETVTLSIWNKNNLLNLEKELGLIFFESVS